jgi:hypothetical protein
VYLEGFYQNKSIPELLAMPEINSYAYNDGNGYVCSAFVANILYHANVLDYEFNFKEITPRDLYILDIYEN